MAIRHILFSCLLYLFEFPTLLAKREIIANAFVYRYVMAAGCYTPKPMQKYEKTFNQTVAVLIFLSISVRIFAKTVDFV